MEDTKNKRTSVANQERRVTNKKRVAQEKKTKSDTTTISSENPADQSVEDIIVVGKGCGFIKSKYQESGHLLHECHSETSLYPPPDNKSTKELVCEGLQPVLSTYSNTSFISAKSAVSLCNALEKQDQEVKESSQDETTQRNKKQLVKQCLTEFSSTSTETDPVLDKNEDDLKLKEFERKLSNKEKKIKDLNYKLEECTKAKEIQIQENKGLIHQVHVLNRQLQSLYELVGQKNWNKSVDTVELAKYKTKAAELEACISAQASQQKELQKQIEKTVSALQSKEKELNMKNKELVEYKNKSTLELCKLLNQVDCLQKEAKTQSQMLESKIMEAQQSMDDEIVNITQKLEDQYQKDVKSAIEKLQTDFERLASLPKSAIEKLLLLCEPNRMDLVTFQKEWDKQQTVLESKISAMETDHQKELKALRDSYESKIGFLKTQIETLVSQLKERKEILDVFEKELMIYKSNSTLNLLRVSSRGDDISSLKEMYAAEIVSQKQVHKLQMDLFEEKVKTLTEEILYHAKNEEIHLQELENARKMAHSFREKYEQLVAEWEERAERDSKTVSNEVNADRAEFDVVFEEFENLIQSLKKSEEAYEKKIIELQSCHNDDLCSYMRDVESFKKKLQQLESFQKAQSKLDETIQELIKTLGFNYTKTVESLLQSHVTEMSLKQEEMSSIEKLYSEEVITLKYNLEKEVTELRDKLKDVENSKANVEKELNSLKKSSGDENEEIQALKQKIEDLSLELLKHDGMIAIKEETELALTNRIKELEDLMKAKEENCRKELEDLVAKFIEVKVLSAAKEDLSKELEDKLNKSEELLEKSSRDVDQLFELCCSLGKNLSNMESMWSTDSGNKSDTESKISFAKTNGERLKLQLLETMESMEFLEEKVLQKQKENKTIESLDEDLNSALEKNFLLNEEKNKVLNENEILKLQNSSLLEALDEKDKAMVVMNGDHEGRLREEEEKLKKKLEKLEEEKNQILLREELVTVERDEILERNEVLEDNVRELNERIDYLMVEMANNRGPEEEIYSISLQEVRVLYQEEQEMDAETMRNPSTTTVSCQVDFFSEETQDFQTEGINLTEERERPKNHEREMEEDSQSGASLDAEMSSMLYNVQSELFAVVKERDKLLNVKENLEKENKYLKEMIQNLKEENYCLSASCEAKIKILSEKADCSFDEDSSVVSEMKREIGKLSNYIKTLSSKLDKMKASNESLLNESHEHLKHNQNLVTELEEAWSQRYEIEDQLAKVRKENALLNLHRAQLEETNRRISNLVAEGKPSVVSWIKIHETVENIIDEVLALKTSFSDSGSCSGASTGFDVAKTSSELKMMAENLYAQLQNKTILCDEVLIQKETLEKELKNLEDFLKQTDSRLSPKKNLIGDSTSRDFVVKKRQLETVGKQSIYPSEKLPALGFDHAGNSEDTQLMNLNRLKKRLENQVELEEAQFRENLELEIKGLKKEILELEDSPQEVVAGPDGSLNALELKYEEEVAELTKEFEREVEKLREVFALETGSQGTGTVSDEARAKYLAEIENLKTYFEGKWVDLEKRYQELYRVQNEEKLNSSSQTNQPTEVNPVVNEFLRILLEEKENEACQRTRAQKFLIEVLKRHEVEIDTLQNKYRESLNEIENNHVVEIQNLKSVVTQLKENILSVLSREEEGKIVDEVRHESLLQALREEYEEKLEKEKQTLNDLLEEVRQKHEKEISALEEFWTEKLSECETKCAIMKATGEENKERRNQSAEGHPDNRKSEQNTQEEFEEKKDSQFKELESFCSSCLSSKAYFGEMELRTDDDKLEIVRERDTLKEAVTSLRFIVAKLLSFIGQYRMELNSTIDNEETMYKSIQMDSSTAECSLTSNSACFALDLSTIVQEINENSLLNSSDQVRFELDRCLKQLKKEATNLLALSRPETSNQNLKEIVKKLEREKNNLEVKVCRVEEMQDEIKKEIATTKDRLSQWERNLEVVSEGYGEEIVEPRKVISLSEFKDKIKLFLADQPQINLLDEICKEGDRLLEEWNREKFDLQQQIEVADKQLNSFKKFVEEQAAEREQEREAFDKEINELKESLKAKDRDNLLQNRTNREVGREVVMSLADQSVETLEAQLKELSNRLSDSERDKAAIEGEFQNAVKKIWSLREVIQDLEVQLAEVSERELNLKKKNEKLDVMLEEQTKINRELKEELDACKNQNEIKFSEHIKNLEEELNSLRRVADQIGPEALSQLKSNLREIEIILTRKTKDLEQFYVSSANASCSSHSEDVSLRDQLDATRCSTPEEMTSNTHPEKFVLPLEEIDRVQEKLARHNRAEEAAMKCIRDLKMRMKNDRKSYEEIQTERDVLLEKVDVYLKENSSLKVRLEEQRCNAGLLQKQLNANLESQISRLEVDVEKLNELCVEKDKQLRDYKEILENTTKALKIRESEVLNKSKEENALITTLKADLANTLDENQKLEEKLETMKEKLREKSQMPALIDSMIDEKNAEIDRLEKEVFRLSGELSSLSKSQDSKNAKRIKFSEPDSFGDCISSISAPNPSTIRNCSDSCAEFKGSPFRISRQPLHSSSKIESISSIGPLQLSPRGTDMSFSWKASTPFVGDPEDTGKQSKSPSVRDEFPKFIEECKLKTEIESKQREILELNLEIDILKRQLVEVNQELTIAKSQYKEAQNDILSREEEIKTLQNNEKGLMMSIESLKKNHTEEVEELQSQLNFERGKVEKVYDEIKTLEVKKIEIEEAFLNLKEEYNEKLNKEQKAEEALIAEVKDLEAKNEKLLASKESQEKEFYERCQLLAREISETKEENEKLKISCLNLSKRSSVDAEVQVGEKGCDICKKTLELENTEIKTKAFKENIEKLRKEFEKMAEVLTERDFGKKEAFSYAMVVRRILSNILNNVDDLQQELEGYRKKLMECSVDDLAVKVQKELVLSAKLDNELLSSIEANGLVQKTSQTTQEIGGGDCTVIVPLEKPNAVEVCKELMNKIAELEKEKENLITKIMQMEKIIGQLEERLENESEIIQGEKERCNEDAKIMELLRVNLEKSLQDLRSKERELKKEKQARIALEKEIELLKKHKTDPEGKKVADLARQLEIQKEKLVSLGLHLEEEKRKTQEMRLLLEQNKIDRMSEKGTQKLLESDLALVRDQKESLKVELINARKALDSRNVEIGLLKRKINLQEIDIKALSLTSDFHRQSASETSSVVNKFESSDDVTVKNFPKQSMNLNLEMSPSLRENMKKLNKCFQLHLKESTDMEEALLYLSRETEKMRDMIRKLEENRTKSSDDTLVSDFELDKRLWALEKGALVMEIENLKRELDSLKQKLIETYKNNEILKKENNQLTREIKSARESANQIENGFLQDRISHLTRRCMRAESYRKALAWQKNYLLLTYADQRHSEEEALKKIRSSSRRRRTQKRCGRFRVVALAVVAIFRMRYIVKRWQRTNFHVLPSSQAASRKFAPLASVLNIYNEPVNPLSYQTQNIIRPSSKVLRTPPSRDPGLQAYSLDVLKVSDCLEAYNQFKENIGTAKIQ